MSKETIDFINRHASDVIKSVEGTGLFPSLKMAQMIIESSGKDENGKFAIGKGMAVRKANNYFGVKADKSWTGKKVQLKTPKDGNPVSWFRVYESPLDSLKDHTRFLQQNPRYKINGVFTAKTPQAQALALQKAKYSESPTYDKTLIGIIKAYNLEQLDKTPAGSFKGLIIAAGITILCASVYCFREHIKSHFSQEGTIKQLTLNHDQIHKDAA